MVLSQDKADRIREDIVTKLRDKKLRERQEGLTQLSDTIKYKGEREAAQILSSSTKAGEVLFGALFEALSTETNDAKATTSVKEKRMEGISGGIRQLVGFVNTKIASKVATFVLKNIVIAIKHGRTLDERVALDLMHTALTMLQLQSHVDALEHELWQRLVALCFNVLLGDSLSIPFILPHDHADQREGEPTPDASSDEMEVDDSAPLRKRRRVDNEFRSTKTAFHIDRDTTTVSPMDKACMGILVILLRSNSSPLVDSEFPDLPPVIFNRCLRFLHGFPPHISLHDDFIPGLSAIVSRYTLNQLKETWKFTTMAWIPLLGVWRKTKSKQTKEHLVVILRRLLPFLTSEAQYLTSDTFDFHEHLRELHDVLEAEESSRLSGRIPYLGLESLRLQVLSDDRGHRPFVAETFQYGWNFTTEQALAWSTIDLRAECMVKLYLLSESPSSYARASRKRTKMEDPISSLLSSFNVLRDESSRLYRLQCLLFVVDRHWHALHVSLQQAIMGVLLELLQRDDLRSQDALQSWVLICAASVTHACGTSKSSLAHTIKEDGPWDKLWTQAMHRSQQPQACRAACHLAHILLRHSSTLLPSSAVFMGIENLSRDIIVQGPSFPYDSVCTFLSLCIRVASQDVRLFRMQLGDKILTWFLDTWRPTRLSYKKGISPNNISDILALLMTIAGLYDPVDLLCEVTLPDGVVVEAALDDYTTAQLRQFALEARLPPFVTESKETTSPYGHDANSSRRISGGASVPPELGIKERRISSFISDNLETYLQEFSAENLQISIERLRSVLDLAALALCFEAAVLPGSASTTLASQKAWKLLHKALLHLSEPRWTCSDRALALSAIDPLHMAEHREQSIHNWDILLPPVEGSGIRTDILRSLAKKPMIFMSTARRDLQRNVFKFTENLLPPILEQLENLMRQMVGNESAKDATDDEDSLAMVDDMPVRVARDASTAGSTLTSSRAFTHAMRVCVDSLLAFHVLQSPSGESVRGDSFAEILDGAEGLPMITFGSAFLTNVARSIVRLTPQRLSQIADFFLDSFRTYTYKFNEDFQLLAVLLLRSTLHIWTQSPPDSDLQNDMAHICQHVLVQMRSWKVRDQIVRLLSCYLSTGLRQENWPPSQDSNLKGQRDERTATRLHEFLQDDDIRVRLRAATANAQSFAYLADDGLPPLDRYRDMREHLCRELEKIEGMLTRLLFLGDVFIVCSTIRKGAYWHLIETSLYMKTYDSHVEAILASAAQRLRLPSVSTFFELYASQIATSICRSDKEFVNITPSLLGYGKKRAECFAAALRAFTPTYLLADGAFPDGSSRGPMLFEGHVRVVENKTAAEAIEDCFPPILGHLMLNRVADYPNAVPEGPEGLQDALKKQLGSLSSHIDLDTALPRHIDGIIAVILQSLDNGDVSLGSEIDQCLSSHSDAVADVFRSLTKFRSDLFPPGEVNLPAFGVEIVVKALQWALACATQMDEEALTYHVLHHLVAQLEQSPLLTEQLRLLNSLSLWVAYRYRHFQARTEDLESSRSLRSILLKNLVNSAINVMDQQDLARGAQSILDWAFSQVETLPDMDGLADALLRVACIAHDFSKGVWDDTAQLGRDIMEWIEGVAVELYRVRRKEIRAQVANALSAWPRITTNSLKDISEKADHHQLFSMLDDTQITSNKFRLVRRLHDLTLRDHSSQDSGSDAEEEISKRLIYRVEQFAKSEFWKLKTWIPAPDHLLTEDVQAFANLLFLHGGHVDGIDNEIQEPPSIRSYHLQLYKVNGGCDEWILPRRSIITGLLKVLNGPSASQVRLAFHTMRALVSVAPNDFKSLGTSLQAELDLLRAHPHSTAAAPAQESLQDLLSDEENSNVGYSQWIRALSRTLCHALSQNEPFYGPLTSIVEEDVVFAEQVCPVLVYALLHGERSGKIQQESKKVLSEYFIRALSSPSAPLPCHRVIVDTVLHLRNFRPPAASDPLASERWLAIDHILLSRGAIACGSYTTALLFAELSVEGSSDPEAKRIEMEDILYGIYSHIDEPDGFYGIKTKDQHRFLVRRFHHEGQWSKSFEFHGATFESQCSDRTASMGLVQALHAFGFNRFAMSTLQNTLQPDDLNSSTMTYHLGWRTETWDLPELHTDKPFGKSLYLALRAIHRERNTAIIKEVINSALAEELDRLRTLGNENIVEIRQATQALLCLNAIRQFQSWQPARISGEIQNAQCVQLETEMRFEDVEALAATRMSLLRSFKSRQPDGKQADSHLGVGQNLLDAEIKCLLQLSESARKAGMPQVALNSVVQARELSREPRFDIAFEDAQVLWIKGQPRPAMQYLETFCAPVAASCLNADNTTSQTVDQLTAASVYAAMGTWAFEASLTKPSTINSEYFSHAVSLATSEGFTTRSPREVGRERGAIYHKYALFAERQYTAIIKSPDALRWKIYADRKTQEIEERNQEMKRLKSQTRGDPSVQLLARENSRAIKIQEQYAQLYEEHKSSRKTFLEVAAKMYSQALLASDDYDDEAPIRLCSLWLANPQTEFQTAIKSSLRSIPSHKFVFLAHQLTARACKSSLGEEQRNLCAVVLRMCKEHPYHCLLPLYCLGPAGSRSRKTAKSSSNRSQASLPDASPESTRGLDIWKTLLGMEESYSSRVREVERVYDACLEWAEFPLKDKLQARKLKKDANGKYIVPSEVRKLAKLRDVMVPVITAHVPLDKSGAYKDFVCIKSYDTAFSVAGGQSRPKIIYCAGSDGKKYKQLFKGEGNDDLRQDAVMEQAFVLVNKCLLRDREAKKRRLRVRDYKVIPLAAQAGVLEFVSNTESLDQFLKKAHVVYNPRGNPNMGEHISDELKQCREDCRRQGVSPEERRQRLTEVFLGYRPRFPPVMRHLFTERYKVPSVWFKSRLNYSRSAATTSIVGHVLGLGDRHLQNILIDNHAEIVHIDLGISFEQGKMLPIPEIVPFRLTADMVDGLGISGTQGVFQRCAEETLRVLRDNSGTFMTVLEVFKHDPLYSWVASESRKRRAQAVETITTELTAAIRLAGIEMPTDTVEEAADRALNTVSQKLSNNVSIQFTVNELIAEATDPANLANMYMGWSPQY